MLPAIMFGGLNLVLLLGAGVWFFLRRRRGKDADDDQLDLDDLLEDVSAEVTNDVAGAARATSTRAPQEDAA